MHDDGPSDEACALIAGYVEGALTPAQCRRLRELIRKQPRLARMLAESLHLEGEIRDLIPAQPTRRYLRRLRSRYRPSDRPSPAWITTAALAAAGLIIFLSMAIPEERKIRKSPTPVVVVPPKPEELEPKTWRSEEAPRPDPSPSRHRDDERPPSPMQPPKQNQPEPEPGPQIPGDPPKLPKTIAEVPVQKPVAVAQVDEATDAVVISDDVRTPIAGSCDLFAGQTLETGAAGRMVIRYHDGTRVGLESKTAVSEIAQGTGKRLRIDRGAIWANVARQPRNQPLILEAPHGQATVLGTFLRIIAEPGDQGSTLLQVTEGKVDFRNTMMQMVRVQAGTQAVADRGSKISHSSIPKSRAEKVLEENGSIGIGFGAEGRKLPRGFLNDAGQMFEPDRGYGWERSVGFLPRVDPDSLKTGFVGGGTRTNKLAWRMRVPNGKYAVSVCVGGVAEGIPDQGPHHVVVEGKVIVNAKITSRGEFLTTKPEIVEVTDGELTVVLGGHGSNQKTSDNDDDTILNYLTIRRR